MSAFIPSDCLEIMDLSLTRCPQSPHFLEVKQSLYARVTAATNSSLEICPVCSSVVSVFILTILILTTSSSCLQFSPTAGSPVPFPSSKGVGRGAWRCIVERVCTTLGEPPVEPAIVVCRPASLTSCIAVAKIASARSLTALLVGIGTGDEWKKDPSSPRDSP